MAERGILREAIAQLRTEVAQHGRKIERAQAYAGSVCEAVTLAHRRIRRLGFACLFAAIVAVIAIVFWR